MTPDTDIEKLERLKAHHERGAKLERVYAEAAWNLEQAALLRRTIERLKEKE